MEGLGVKTERQVELTALEQRDGVVRARLRHGAGREEEVNPAWLLGCDGAHSSVRQMLQVPFEGAAIKLNFLLGDLELEGPDAPDDELGVHFHQGGDLIFMARLNERITRLIVALHDEGGKEDTGHALTTQDFQRAVDRCGVRVTVTGAEWMTPFFVNDRQAQRYRVGQVFLAGDASHIHSPVGGQGMNTGIQDVANLAWKIAAVRRGAGESLLDSYEEERGAVGRQLLQFTERVLRVGTSANRFVEKVRDTLAPMALHLETVRKQAAGFVSETAIQYRASSVVADHGGDGELRAGDRLPDLRWQMAPQGALLEEWEEPVHLALLVNGSQTHAEELRSGLRHARVISVQSGALGNEGRRLLGTGEKLLIVRPDGYVGYRGPLLPHGDWLRYVQQDALA